MTRRDELEAIADRTRTRDGVERAWVANSFQDRLLFVEVPAGATVPDAVVADLRACGLVGANAAYGIDSDESPSSAGPVGEYEQHRFLDVRED